MLEKISLMFFGLVLRIRGKHKKYYSVIWKKSSNLKASELLDIRGKEQYGFREYYFNRDTDKTIQGAIASGRNIMVTGNPLAGKTRAVYEALKTLESPCDVIIPNIVDIDTEDFGIPQRVFTGRKPVVVFDDIDKFVNKNNFTFILNQFVKMDAVIIATCRTGSELNKVRIMLERELIVFGDPVEIKKISKEDAEEIAKKTETEISQTFDGNVGSMILPLVTIKERFKVCGSEERGVLRSIHRLYWAGVYEGRENFSIERIKKVAQKKEEIEKKDYEWKGLFGNLNRDGLIDIENH